MAYASGMRNRRVHIMNRKADVEGDFGRNSGGRGYEYTTTVWAAVTFNKGVKSMREGALDAYDTVMFRMLYTKKVCRESMIVWDDRTFAVQSFNRDYQTNEIQITATEAPGKDLTGLVPPPPSSSELGDGELNNANDLGEI